MHLPEQADHEVIKHRQRRTSKRLISTSIWLDNRRSASATEHDWDSRNIVIVRKNEFRLMIVATLTAFR